MREFIEVTGKTEDEAVAKALAQLGLDRDDVSVDCLLYTSRPSRAGMELFCATARLVTAMALCKRAFSQENFMVALPFRSEELVAGCLLKKKR